MKLVKGLFCIALLGSVIPLNSLAAQGQRQTSDPEVERLRIQAEERAREETEQQNWETRIFPVKYVDLGQLNNALSMFRAKMQISPELHVISVRAPKEIMPAIEDAIKRLDVPQPRKEAELTIYVIIASDQAEPSAAIPPVLNPVINQLKGVLAYKSYRVLDTLITRGTNNGFGNQTSLSGTLALSETLKPTFNFRARFQIENPDGKTPVLRLNEMNFGLGGGGMNSAGISGNVEIPQGQQVVVGKATLGDKALILVMSAKFD
jgi:hypothetical protein